MFISSSRVLLAGQCCFSTYYLAEQLFVHVLLGQLIVIVSNHLLGRSHLVIPNDLVLRAPPVESVSLKERTERYSLFFKTNSSNVPFHGFYHVLHLLD